MKPPTRVSIKINRDIDSKKVPRSAENMIRNSEIRKSFAMSSIRRKAAAGSLNKAKYLARKAAAKVAGLKRASPESADTILSELQPMMSQQRPRNPATTTPELDASSFPVIHSQASNRQQRQQQATQQQQKEKQQDQQASFTRLHAGHEHALGTNHPQHGGQQHEMLTLLQAPAVQQFLSMLKLQQLQQTTQPTQPSAPRHQQA